MRTIATAVALLLVAGCGDREQANISNAGDTALMQTGEPMPETGGAPDAPRTFAFEQRQEFAQSMRDQLTDLDRQIEELSAQAKSTGGAVSDRALANIRAARQAVDRNLDRVDTATAENWEEIRQGVEESVEHLSEAVEMAYPK